MSRVLVHDRSVAMLLKRRIHTKRMSSESVMERRDREVSRGLVHDRSVVMLIKGRFARKDVK